jgi:toxin-antitoxin system PIN domain toxin
MRRSYAASCNNPTMLLDANLLIYSFHRGYPEHPAARAWLDAEIDRGEPVVLHPLAASAFLRIVTNRIGTLTPSPINTALDFLSALQPAIPETLLDDAAHLEIFRRLAARHAIAGDGCTDVWLAAFAIRHRLTFASADVGFARFQPELQWLNPLSVV